MSIAIITHPDCLLHDMGHLLPEVPDRVRVIEEALLGSGLEGSLKNVLAPLATREQLLRAHNAEYIDTIIQSVPTSGFYSLDPDTYMNPYSLQAALRAAGALVRAVDLVMAGDVSAAFCNVRPPGHHALHDAAMGFCIFNNVAIGAAHALAEHNLKKVAIIDFDVHHGNGTEDIFRQEKRVLYCSSFEHPFYPFSGAETHNQHIINIPLPAGSDGRLFREKANEHWFQAIRAFKPELLFFSAGFDAYYKDAMANLRFNEADYAWITREIVTIADEVCDGRVVSALEGGYALDTLGSCALAHIREIIRN
jgi:acetoin utilization deacetylase AcuC-like enzyme